MNDALERAWAYCNDSTVAQDVADIMRDLVKEIDARDEELGKYRNGYQGSCYCCEPVGMANQVLSASNARMRAALTEIWQLDSPGLCGDIAKEALEHDEGEDV